MINDGCPVTGDSSMHIRGNGNSLQGRFDIKMFKFIGDDLNDVWLHCTVRACNATEADSCVPDCSEDGRKRRNAEDDEDFVPAAGKQLNYVSLVVLLAIVFGITCMLVRRRRQTMKALTESQFS